MSGDALVQWLLGECRIRKIPPTDSAMILVLRSVIDIDAWVKTLRNESRGAGSSTTKVTRQGTNSK